MTAPAETTKGVSTSASHGTALAERTPAQVARDLKVAEAKELNAMVVAIRGTQWGQDCSPAVQRAVAHYCNRNGLDAVRHVEVLGGRIYLTGELYEERGAPLVLAGKVVLEEPRFVQDDPRFATLASDADAELAAWAKQERRVRAQTRVALGIPDDVTGACVYRARVGDTILVGFNWCGGSTKVKRKRDGSTYRSDPVGDAEPVKTAQSRAKRRLWRQIVVALPEFEATMGAIEASARIASDELVEVVTAETAEAKPHAPQSLLAAGDDPYSSAAAVVSVKIAALLKRELAGEALSEEDAEDLRQWRLDRAEAGQEAGA